MNLNAFSTKRVFGETYNARARTYELAGMEKVRRYLLDNDITDVDSFNDYLTEIE